MYGSYPLFNQFLPIIYKTPILRKKIPIFLEKSKQYFIVNKDQF